MTQKIAATLVILLLGAGGTFAHRLDEYLQATILSVDKNTVHGSMRLVPGVAVYPAVLAIIDENADGALSENEKHAYALRVLSDLSLSSDGHRLIPTLVSANFPTLQELKEGLGQIQIEFAATLPPGATQRTLVLENHHQNSISVYLVNSLIPGDPDIRISAQNRNENQSFYRLDYVQVGGISQASFFQHWKNFFANKGSIGFASIFRLGMRHIAEGTDHLLFLLTLLLTAPLLVFHSRWSGIASIRDTFKKIVKVVTAFTLGHSITLALAAMGLFQIPSRPIEILIAVSILISAVHAFRPVFSGREAVIAASFGLIHGLAFATTLRELGLGKWEQLTGILAFNLGIESMQLLVVLAIMPSLILLARTGAYSPLRIGGALFACLASLGWIVERLLGVHTSVDKVVDNVAHRGVWIAASLLGVSLVLSLVNHFASSRSTLESFSRSTLKRA